MSILNRKTGYRVTTTITIEEIVKDNVVRKTNDLLIVEFVKNDNARQYNILNVISKVSNFITNRFLLNKINPLNP